MAQLEQKPDVRAIFSEIKELHTTIDSRIPFQWNEVLDL